MVFFMSKRRRKEKKKAYADGVYPVSDSDVWAAGIGTWAVGNLLQKNRETEQESSLKL